MKRFMIGQFGTFDDKKQNRDFREDFFGVEACLLDKNEDINKLISLIEDDKLSLGIHFPLRTKGWRLRDPQYLSLDDTARAESYDYMSKEFEFVKGLNPHYVLLHYPKPVILDNDVDWTNWRFADETEYYYASEYSYDEFKQKSRNFFRWLSAQGKENNFIPVLELDALGRYIYDSNLLEELLNEFNNIKLCLDIGRLHLLEIIDKNFDSFKFVKKYAKYAEVIHLWDVKITSNIENSHYPVSPKHSPKDGWADVKQYIGIIREENKDCKVMFEHRSDVISDDELNQCYQWIDSLL